MRLPLPVAVTLVALTTACDGQLIDPIQCTEELRAGITVEVVDRSTGQPLADEATLTLREADYVETWTEAFDGRTLAGAWERAGTYQVAVALDGYHIWIGSSVVVTTDVCHVHPVALRAEMERLPAF